MSRPGGQRLNGSVGAADFVGSNRAAVTADAGQPAALPWRQSADDQNVATLQGR